MSVRSQLAETQRENSKLRVQLNELKKELTIKNLLINNLMGKLTELRTRYEGPPNPTGGGLV